MEEQLIKTLRNKYKIRKEQYGKEHTFGVSTKEDYEDTFSFFSDGDVSFIEVGQIVDNSVLNNINFLLLEYLDNQNYQFLIKSDKELKNLKHLQSSFAYLINSNPIRCLSSIEGLTIMNSYEWYGDHKLGKRDLSKSKILENVRNDKLLFLRVMTLSTAKHHIEPFVSFSHEQFPNLEYVSFNTYNNTTLLDKLTNFTNLNHIDLGGVYVDLVPYLNSSVQTLQIESAGDDFTVEHFCELPNLEAIWLNSIHNELDCEHFVKSKSIKEITIYNSPKLKNIEALAMMTNLENLKLVSCENAISTTVKDKLQKKNFANLNIDFN